MKYDAKEFKQYPEVMNKEQMRIACHISKRTALYLLQFNLIPHTCTGKKTRCYSIKKSDVIAFMNDREVNPEKYIAPENWYKYGDIDVKAYKIRIQPQLDVDSKKHRRFYESTQDFSSFVTCHLFGANPKDTALYLSSVWSRFSLIAKTSILENENF